MAQALYNIKNDHILKNNLSTQADFLSKLCQSNLYTIAQGLYSNNSALKQFIINNDPYFYAFLNNIQTHSNITQYFNDLFEQEKHAGLAVFSSSNVLENIGILKFNHNLNPPPSKTQLTVGSNIFILSETAQETKPYIDRKQWIECQKSLGFGPHTYIATLDQIKSLHMHNPLVFIRDALQSAIFHQHNDLAKFLVSHNYTSVGNSGLNSPLDLAIKQITKN